MENKPDGLKHSGRFDSYKVMDDNELDEEELIVEEYDEEEEVGEEEDDDLTEALLVQMGYWKPEPKETIAVVTPSASVKLVSAMKGSRDNERSEGDEEKEKEKRVSWAPDVYDPVPRSMEEFSAKGRTVVKMKIETKKEKKHNEKKNKEKLGSKGSNAAGAGGGGGGGKGGGKGKDKKQSKKHGGGSKLFSSMDGDW